MTLTDKELQSFHENGFIILRGFLDKRRCEAILKVAQTHLEQKIEPLETEIGYRSRSRAYRTDVSDYQSHAQEKQKVVRRLRQVYDRDILFQQWMKEPSIRPILQQILGEQVVLVLAHHNSIMTKMPSMSFETKWHQDRRYWRYSDDNLVSVWLALGEENSDNGALEFIPKSHTMVFQAQQFDTKEYFSESFPMNKATLNQKIAINLQEGDVVIFHSLLLHRANNNQTNHTKFSFVYTVKGISTKAIAQTRSSQYPQIPLSTR